MGKKIIILLLSKDSCCQHLKILLVVFFCACKFSLAVLMSYTVFKVVNVT